LEVPEMRKRMDMRRRAAACGGGLVVVDLRWMVGRWRVGSLRGITVRYGTVVVVVKSRGMLGLGL
jgi:hypothetical protein